MVPEEREEDSMKRWFVVLVVMLGALIIPSAASAQVRLVKKLASASGPVSGYGYTMPVADSSVSNDTLVLIANNPNRQITRVSDSKGNAWTQDAYNNGVSIWHALLATPLSLAGNDRINVVLSAPAPITDAVVEEFSGIDPSGPVDAVVKQSYGNPSPASVTENVTARRDHDLFVDAVSFLPKARSGPSGFAQLNGTYQFSSGYNPDLGLAGTHPETWSSGLAGVSGTSRASVLYRAYIASTAKVACTKPTASIHQYVNGCALYHPGSWVNSPLPTNAPIDPRSASMAAKFRSQINIDSNGNVVAGDTGGKRWISYADVYVQNRTDRNNWKTVCSREVLNGTSWPWMTALHNAWVTFKAPIPATGFPNTDGGSDHGATLYNGATGEMWDFYEWRGAAAGGTTDLQGRACNYVADGGDYQHNVPSSPGYFITQPLGSVVQESNMWGRTAAALPSIAGAITPDEWNHPLAGINHTLEVTVPCADPTKQYWPAERHDGCVSGLGGLPEGSRVRISPAVTCPHGTARATGPRQLAYDRAYEICVTAQRYGIIVNDQTGSGVALDFALPIGGKPFTNTPDGGNCCSARTTPGTGTQWPNWYWDLSISHEMPYLQVVDPSYRPPYAPRQ